MTPLFAALSILGSIKRVSYDFPVGSESKYSVKVQFDGYVPLFGGKNGKVDVDMVIKAIGVDSKKPGLQAVDSEIIDLKAIAFGSTLPLNKNNIGAFFPRAIATFESSGVVKSNDAPQINMPVKLPGLDSTRLPEISYLPLIVNHDATMKGEAYEFTRTFNGAPIKYKVSPGINNDNDGRVILIVEVNQESQGFEDAYGNPIVEEGAKSKLKTVLTGKGRALFNIVDQKFDKVVVETTGDTDVTNIKTGKITKRTLKTTLTIVRDGVKIDE